MDDFINSRDVCTLMDNIMNGCAYERANVNGLTVLCKTKVWIFLHRTYVSKYSILLQRSVDCEVQVYENRFLKEIFIVRVLCMVSVQCNPDIIDPNIVCNWHL